MEYLTPTEWYAFNALQWPIEKTHQVIWDALHAYGKIEWQRTLSDLEKAQDVAYQDVLDEFDFWLVAT